MLRVVSCEYVSGRSIEWARLPRGPRGPGYEVARDVSWDNPRLRALIEDIPIPGSFSTSLARGDTEDEEMRHGTIPRIRGRPEQTSSSAA